MDAYTHAEISVRKRGGCTEDYYPIHFLLDSTKELCSDNRHRILHNLWGIRRVIIPIFGPVRVNSEGKTFNVKEVCEHDHVLPDYSNRFIPTLEDFVNEFEALTTEETKKINTIYSMYRDFKSVQSLLQSPLNVTGQLKSLRITHNVWFCNEIIPRIFDIPFRIEEDWPIDLFNKMSFSMWMDNGTFLPVSAAKMNSVR